MQGWKPCSTLSLKQTPCFLKSAKPHGIFAAYVCLDVRGCDR